MRLDRVPPLAGRLGTLAEDLLLIFDALSISALIASCSGLGGGLDALDLRLKPVHPRIAQGFDILDLVVVALIDVATRSASACVCVASIAAASHCLTAAIAALPTSMMPCGLRLRRPRSRPAISPAATASRISCWIWSKNGCASPKIVSTNIRRECRPRCRRGT